jgi:hypothetical protein
MNYIKYNNEIYRKKRYCEKYQKMYYLKKISKIKTGKYFYVYLDKNRINFDRALQIVPDANKQEIKEIMELIK